MAALERSELKGMGVVQAKILHSAFSQNILLH